MAVNIRKAAIIGTLVLGALGVSAVAMAAPTETKPGWGYGDTNHVHTGPPGLSVRAE